MRQRYWRVYAKQTCRDEAIEQPLVFVHNDLPGIMLAGAVRQYANRYGIAAGRQVVLATNNDSAYLAALDFVAAGAPVRPRPRLPCEAPTDLAMAARAASRLRHRCGEGARAQAAGADRARQRRDHRLRRARHLRRLAACVHLWSHARAPIAFDAGGAASCPRTRARDRIGRRLHDASRRASPTR